MKGASGFFSFCWKSSDSVLALSSVPDCSAEYDGWDDDDDGDDDATNAASSKSAYSPSTTRGLKRVIGGGWEEEEKEEEELAWTSFVCSSFEEKKEE